MNGPQFIDYTNLTLTDPRFSMDPRVLAQALFHGRAKRMKCDRQKLRVVRSIRKTYAELKAVGLPTFMAKSPY